LIGGAARVATPALAEGVSGNAAIAARELHGGAFALTNSADAASPGVQ
jgi:hypothetical protein